jgi:DNA-binding transcriptional ArsR family regulator
MTASRPRTDLDEVLSALADPTRRSLFAVILADPGITTSQLAARTSSVSRWGVIKHLAVLREAGLVQTMATGRLRRHYAERAALGSLRSWLGEVGT